MQLKIAIAIFALVNFIELAPTSAEVGQQRLEFGSTTINLDDSVVEMPSSQTPSEAFAGPVTKQPSNCRTQRIAERAFPPDDYDRFSVPSPHEEQYQLNVAVGSFQYYVHMPESSSDPYTLGPNGDFDGLATICRVRDKITGKDYETVHFNANWKSGAGGVYNVYFGYVPFNPGTGAEVQKVSVNRIFLVDGAWGGEDGKDDKCLAAASYEDKSLKADLVVMPKMYFEDKGDVFVQKLLKIIDGVVPIDSVSDFITETDKKYKLTNSFRPPYSDPYRISILYAGHGHIDAAWLSSENGSLSGFQGENQNVEFYGQNVRKKVRDLKFFTCCTAKNYVLGKTPNVLDSMADKISSNGADHVEVCGYQHQVATYTRNGKPYAGIVKDDGVCTKR